MIWIPFLNWWGGILDTLIPHAFDLNLDTNNYLLFALSYIFSFDHWFPMHDAYIPIFFLYVVIYTFLGVMKGTEVILNVFRGAGIRL